MSGWTTDYRERLLGKACKLCAEGSPEETASRLRFYSSDLCDAYVQKLKELLARPSSERDETS